jgi:hypothetical protein
VPPILPRTNGCGTRRRVRFSATPPVLLHVWLEITSQGVWIPAAIPKKGVFILLVRLVQFLRVLRVCIVSFVEMTLEQNHFKNLKNFNQLHTIYHISYIHLTALHSTYTARVMASQNSSQSIVPSELKLSKAWDTCIERGIYRIAIGTMIGGMTAVVLFRE